MNKSSILFVGPLPPPIHGFSEINKRMLLRLQAVATVDVFDTSPRNGGLLNLLKLFINFLRAAYLGGSSSLYLPLSGGLRQLVDVCFAGTAMVFGLQVFVHHHSFRYLNQRPLYARLVLGLLRNAKHIVLCERMGNLLCSNYSIKENKVRVISNAVFLDDIDRPSRFESHNGKLIIGFLSNITVAKGCFEFINLVNAAKMTGLEVQGLMAGPVDEEINSKLKDAVRRAGCIELVGPVYGENKNKFFSQIDLLVFPTSYVNEAEPVTIWEAMAAGVPVISLSRGCISGMINSDVGWVIESPERFIDEGLAKIKYLLSSDSALVKMKHAARAELENAKMKYLNNLNALILEIAGNDNASRPV